MIIQTQTWKGNRDGEREGGGERERERTNEFLLTRAME